MFLATNEKARFGSVEWPRVAAVIAATRTYLSRRHPSDVANFDALSREPDWVPVVTSVHRPMMGITASLEEDQRVSAAVGHNQQKISNGRPLSGDHIDVDR